MGFEDNSIAYISSHMAVGHYSGLGSLSYDQIYTDKILQTAFQKMKSDGRIRITVGGSKTAGLILGAMRKAGFEERKTDILQRPEEKKTYWARRYAQDHTKSGREEEIIAITAKKKSPIITA